MAKKEPEKVVLRRTLSGMMIRLLPLENRPLWNGAPSGKEKRRRRAANKVAKQSRKINRKAA
jgi:hypothetical protein